MRVTALTVVLVVPLVLSAAAVTAQADTGGQNTSLSPESAVGEDGPAGETPRAGELPPVDIAVEPATLGAPPGETSVYNVTVSNVTAGVAAHDIDVTVGDDVVEFVDFDLLYDPLFPDSEVRDEDGDGHNETFSLVAAYGPDAIEGAGSVVLAQVTVAALGEAGETTEVTPDPEQAAVSAPDSSENYPIGDLVNATFEVEGFDATIAGGTDPVVEGETIDVVTQITNTGEPDTQQVTLDIEGLGTTSTSVELGTGESTEETLSVLTESGDAGTYTATITSEDDSETANTTVLTPAKFEVSISETDEPVVAGETLSVTTEVQNTGEAASTQTVGLTAGSLGENTTSVQLDGGESTVETLSVATEPGDAGTYTATVTSENDSAGTDVTVLAPASFAVGILETSTPAGGEPLTVTASIENTGGVAGTETVALAVGALGGDTANVSLGGGASTEVTLSVATGADDAGTYTATVTSENDTDSTTVTVLSPTAFTVDILETNDSMAGEQLTATVAVNNAGDVETTQNISLTIGDLGTDTASVTLAGGASTNRTLSVTTGPDDAGTYTAVVTSENDSDSTTVTVLAPASFTVDIVETNDPVAGEDLDVLVAVTNVGGAAGTQTVDLAVGDLGGDTASVTLAGGASTNRTLSVATGAGDAGTYTVTVTSEDDSDSTTVTVLEPASFEISAVGTNAPIIEGETLAVTVTVTNTGGVSAVKQLTVTAGDLGTNTTALDASSNETVETTLVLATAIEQAGTYTVTVLTEDDTAERSVELHLPVILGGSGPPTDPDGDDLYENVDGNSLFDIFDVQSLFKNLNTDAVQNHGWAYDFDADGTVDIFDVERLFEEL